MIDLFLNGRRYQTCRIADSITADSGRLYEVNDRIDSGGNGVVHKCADSATGAEFAIKFLLSGGDVDRARFSKELRLMQEVTHDHLIEYVDCGSVEADLLRGRRKASDVVVQYVVMDLADNTLFGRYASVDWNISYEFYISQFRGLSKALAQIHGRALHRDIKPHNILIKGDTWMISDYGLCIFYDDDEDVALTKMDRPFGPKYWMSPEAVNRIIGRPDEISMASDVFQLAAVFWLVVNHQHPTGILTADDWTGPPNLYEVLHRALQHDPGRRQQSGLQFSDEIAQAIAS